MKSVISLISLMIFVLAFACGDPQKDDRADRVTIPAIQGPIMKSPAGGKDGHHYIPGEILIKFKDDTDAESIKSIQEKTGLRTINVISKRNLYRMKIQNGAAVEEVIKSLKDFKEIEYCEPNYIVKFQ